MTSEQRTRAFAQDHRPSSVDRLGRWLSTIRIRRYLGRASTGHTADVGCGYDAALALELFANATTVTLVDISVDPALADDQRFTRLEGYLPVVLDELPSGSFDAIVCNNVLEHLEDPLATAFQLHRLLAQGGRCVVNVPSWRGKFFLETAAFKLGLAPKAEMDDHRLYYDPRDLWPLLVAAGFAPSRIVCKKHKLGVNTIALCTK
jgi:2-polyprenyl-3-methyl-5-hydroxy-6-metoxy-1,4-benzoquinol methylase